MKRGPTLRRFFDKHAQIVDFAALIGSPGGLQQFPVGNHLICILRQIAKQGQQPGVMKDQQEQRSKHRGWGMHNHNRLWFLTFSLILFISASVRGQEMGKSAGQNVAEVKFGPVPQVFRLVRRALCKMVIPQRVFPYSQAKCRLGVQSRGIGIRQPST